MLSTKALQARIYQNKVAQGFNVSNIEKEVFLLHGELAEFYVAIYLLGLAEILQIDIGKEIDRKMNINEHRKYAQIDGVNTRISE